MWRERECEVCALALGHLHGICLGHHLVADIQFGCVGAAGNIFCGVVCHLGAGSVSVVHHARLRYVGALNEESLRGFQFQVLSADRAAAHVDVFHCRVISTGKSLQHIIQFWLHYLHGVLALAVGACAVNHSAACCRHGSTAYWLFRLLVCHHSAHARCLCLHA